VPALNSFDYTILRIVPRVERQEFINAGVILFCLERNFLAARVHFDESRVQALFPVLDLPLVKQHLEAFPRICAGSDDGGPIARLSRRERFHWLAAPRSTVIQVSEVHSGLCESPEFALDQLFRELVLL
jgi:hypothetical protein